MKKALLLTLVCVFSYLSVFAQEDQATPNLFDNGFKFCEGTVAYQNKILVSNFGSSELNPLNDEGKGYILAIENNKVKPFIACDGFLSAPKGMFVLHKHLFIADVQRVVVYDLTKLDKKPVVIKFPEGNKFVNDIIAIGNLVLVSVTDAGKLYAIDASDIDNIANAQPKLLGDVPGANGIAVKDNWIYIASYNPTGTPDAENVIYVADITNPNAPLKKLINNLPAGQYDGIALNNDGTKLFFSAWATKDEPKPAIYVYDLVKKIEARIVDLGVTYAGPADITIKNNVLWIPDLPNSRVFRFDLP